MKTDARIVWTDEIRARVFPARTLRKKAEPIDVDALHALITPRITREWKEYEGYFSKKQSDSTKEWAGFFGALAKKINPKRVALPLDVDQQAAVWTISHDELDLAKYWVGAMGAEFAIRAYVRSWSWDPWGTHLWIDDKTAGRDDDSDWIAMREALGFADDASWDRAKRFAANVRATAHVAMKAPLAFIFDDAAWAAADAREWIERSDQEGQHVLRRGPQLGACLLAVLRDADVATELAKAIVKRGRASGSRKSAGRYLPTLLERLGPVDALAPLGVSLDGATDRDGPADDFARIVSCVESFEAARMLVGHLEHKLVRPIALEHARRVPTFGAAALAEVALSRSKDAETAKRALVQLVRAEPEATARSSALVSDAEKKLLADLANTSQEVASDAETPRVLVEPPWLGQRKPKPRPTIDGLATLPFEESIEWKPREKENALLSTLDEDLLRNWGNLPKTGKRRSKEMDAFVEKKLDIAEKSSKWDARIHFTASILDAMSDKAALTAWNGRPPEVWWPHDSDYGYVLARFGFDALDGTLAHAQSAPQKIVPVLVRVRSPRIAPLMADAAFRMKKVSALAKKWLADNAEAAAIGLLPRAFSGKEREPAIAALRTIDRAGSAGVLRKVADRLGAKTRVALDEVLAFDALDDVPAKIAALPKWLAIDAISRPIVKASRRALSEKATAHLVTMLAFSPDGAYPGIDLVREACDTRSLADMAWDIFLAWDLAGSPSKDDWALVAIGTLGGDDEARKLAPRIRAWPGESAHARAVKGLDVLGAIGTDIALMHLDGIANKVKFKGLQEKARERIEAVAESRGLGREELGDRLVPDLDLDHDTGSKSLSFGARSFRVRFDEHLVPRVVDEAGKLLPDLPKPGKSDEAAAATESVRTWKALKKDAKTIAQHQLFRLERAMCARRRWDVQTFQNFFVDHPLVIHVIRRLVMGVYEGAALRTTFRVAEDRSFADMKDAPFTPSGSIGIVHRLDLDEKSRTSWGAVFGDYEILAPFSQLDREIFEATKEERASSSTERFAQKKLPLGKVLGLEARGWRRGMAQDAGWIWDMIKPLGDDLEAVIELKGGILAGDMRESPAEQELGTLTLQDVGQWKKSERTLASVDPIVTSELYRDLMP